MSDSEFARDEFYQAVAAIDAGDIPALQRLIDANPRLVSERLETPGVWLRKQVGDAADGFFSRPYLLWFVAEDPVRNGRLPSNIAQAIRIIVDAARRNDAATLQDQLDSTLRLVCWSGVAANCGVQLEMIDALIDAGASPARNPNNALVNGHIAAAEHLLSRGATLTLGAALCLERWDDVAGLSAKATPEVRQFAFVLAALNGKAAAVKWMVDSGIAVDEPSADLYPHGTALHHAVCSGSLDTVKVLVDAGANVDRQDSAWHATPLGWADYYEQNSDSERRVRYAAIASYLREAMTGTSDAV